MALSFTPGSNSYRAAAPRVPKQNGFPMNQPLHDALAERGYDILTPVQEAVTNPDLHTADLLVSAQTGSGKTVGFGLAIGPTLLGEESALPPAAAPLALIVAPTRELAFQVSRELDWLYAKARARVVSCVGGMDTRTERRALERGAHIVVGTPGRLRDHITRGALDMSSLRAVVLDEADEMLDLGFREDLEFMLGEAPQDRRTLMFSATVPSMIARLAKEYQRDAVRVSTVSEKSQHADISYQALRVAQQDAENAIINVLRFHEAQNAIVFANTRATVNRLTARLANRGFSVVCLSGELSQDERSHALQAMRDGRAKVCVATDVAARGIDLPNLELVIHAELPSNAEGLLHRSGRTGRAGRKGISALIVPPKLLKKAERLLKFAKITAEWGVAPSFEEVLARDEERLLSDPQWGQVPDPDETDFARRLVAIHAPETIAIAYLRLYRARNSAPEELAAPDARPERKERAPFGPSAWVALSVGRNDRAEPRWILPLLCRAGGLDKDEIGAIRVQQDETFVELTQASAPGFLARLGAGGVLEDGVTARQIEGAPSFGRPSDADPARGPAPKPKHAKPDTAARSNAAPARAQPADSVKPAPAEDAPKPRAKSGKPGKPPFAPHRGHGDAPGGKHRPDRSGKPPRKVAGKPNAGPNKGRSAVGGSTPEESKSANAKGPNSKRPGASDPSKRFESPHRAARAKTAKRKGPDKRPDKGAASPKARKP